MGNAQRGTSTPNDREGFPLEHYGDMRGRVKRRATYITCGLVAVGVVLACALLLAPSQQGKAEQMRKRVEISVIDDGDLNALEQWARSFCKGWSVKMLADDYEVDPNMQAVTEAVAKGLEGGSRRAVIAACEDEIRKFEATNQGGEPG